MGDLTSPPLLAVEGLRVSLDAERSTRLTVDDVSFDVRAGETVALVGETGSGKTVTALSLMGLLPPAMHVAAGSIRLDGRDLVALSEPAMQRVRGREISMVFQNPQASLNPMFRVGSQMVETIHAHREVSKDDARTQAVSLLEMLRLQEPDRVLRAYPHELSGGMCQRVMIALAILSHPRLLVADEPTTALDSVTQAHILGLLQALKGTFVSSLLLITHDLRIVRKVADRVVVLKDGSSVETGQTASVFANPSDAYTQTLVDAARLRTVARL
jgi:ABC-type dipeptide/oligopeptide/nickel transport system ATPase component